MKHRVRACGRFSSGMLLVACASAALPAQDALRGFGQTRFDTDAFALPAVDLATSFTSGAVLRTDGRIFIHGQLPYAAIPNGPPAPTGTVYTQIALGATHAFALQNDGNLVAWADGAVTLPPPPLPANTLYTQVSAGGGHVVARRSDGAAIAWGDNTVGQTSLPTVPAGVGVVQVHAGWSHTLLRLSNGAIVGCGDPARSQPPALPAGVSYTAMWGGDRHTIAARSDGTYVGWGDNATGQCNVPPPPAGVVYTAVGPGGAHTLAARSDGVLVGWGDNSHGQRDVQLPAGKTVAQIVGAWLSSSVRCTDGSVFGAGLVDWGGPVPTTPAGERWRAVAGGYPQVGLTDAGHVVVLDGSQPAPPLPAGRTYTQVASGTGHAVALRSDGRAIAWGSNSSGQLAVPPLPPGMVYRAVDASFGLTLLLRSDGVVVSAGGLNPLQWVPPPGLQYVAISCHYQNVLLRRSDGAVIRGDGSQLVLPPLPAGVRHVEIAAMRTFSAALRSDGRIDLTSTAASNTIPPLPQGVVYVAIEGVDDEFVARRSDGTILSIRTTSVIPTPAPGPGESFTSVSAGIGRVGPTRTYVTFANGCAGTLPASRLVPRDTPYLGGTLEVGVFDLPHDIAWLVFGSSRVPPVPLASIGMPGCEQQVSLDAFTPLVGADGVARHELPIPDLPSLLGASFHHQAVVFDAAANPAGLVVSDAATAVIGRP